MNIVLALLAGLVLPFAFWGLRLTWSWIKIILNWQKHMPELSRLAPEVAGLVRKGSWARLVGNIINCILHGGILSACIYFAWGNGARWAFLAGIPTMLIGMLASVMWAAKEGAFLAAAYSNPAVFIKGRLE